VTCLKQQLPRLAAGLGPNPGAARGERRRAEEHAPAPRRGRPRIELCDLCGGRFVSPPSLNPIQFENSSSRSASVIAVHENTGVEIISIVEDRARLILMQHSDCIGGPRSWVGPLGVLLSALGTLLTSTFRNALGLNSDQWFLVYLLISGASFLWLCRAVALAVRAATIDTIISEMKAEIFTVPDSPVLAKCGGPTCRPSATWGRSAGSRP
jgi:hypothetical protein